MQIDIGLAGLFENVFGVQVSAFDPSLAPVLGDTAAGVTPMGGSARTETGASGSPYYAKDANGREYYMPVTVTYLDDNGKNQTYNLPYPIISIQAKKLVIDTPLTDRRGTVTELIQIENYKIIIKGFCIGKGNEYPEADARMLRTIFEAGGTVNIACPATDIYLLRPDRSGSDAVSIRNFELLPNPGVKHVRAYQIELESDEPFSLVEL